MGHEDVSTTMVYTHVLNRGGRGVRSPLDTEQLATPPRVQVRARNRVRPTPAANSLITQFGILI